MNKDNPGEFNLWDSDSNDDNQQSAKPIKDEMTTSQERQRELSEVLKSTKSWQYSNQHTQSWGGIEKGSDSPPSTL